MAEAVTQGATSPGKPAKSAGRFGASLRKMLVPVLAVFTALVVGGIVIKVSGGDPFLAYQGLWEGAFGSPKAISETFIWATPYIFAGLAVALGFKGGLFNIGAEGQFYIGALFGVWIGFALPGLPMIVHLPLALLGGALAGAIWGGIAGLLKATRGAHEVITTIMLNYIAFALTDFMVNGPLRSEGTAPRTPDVQPGAVLPEIFGAPDRLHWGFVLALLLLVAYWFLTVRMPLGLQIKTIGANPDAARYAGISVPRTTVIAMMISGGLCGLAGAVEVLGVYRYMPAAFTTGYGFDSIAISLLGQGHPVGILIAAILFGAMNNGATYMQFAAGVSNNIIAVLQAFIVIFVGAPAIIKSLIRRDKK